MTVSTINSPHPISVAATVTSGSSIKLDTASSEMTTTDLTINSTSPQDLGFPIEKIEPTAGSDDEKPEYMIDNDDMEGIAVAREPDAMTFPDGGFGWFVGLMYGLGAGMALFTSVAIPVQWFEKKRGLASGITVAGSGIGGATLAPLNRLMISKIGYQWALRIMGILVITLVCSILVCLRTRVTPSVKKRPLLDVTMFKNSGFTAMYFMGMLVTFGYLTPIFLFPNFVTDLGMDPTIGASLVSGFAGVNAFSRIALGFIGDRFGPLNVLIVSTIFTGLCCWVLWMNTHGLAMAVVFMVIYGSNAGGFNSLFLVVAANIIGVESLAETIGLLFSGNLFGNLLGSPLASAIVTASGGSYTWAQVYSGAAPMLAAVLLIVLRFKKDRRILVKL
ncbi:hypothetical protein BGZ80_004918 [Entomortierella chlamydospora]|uniref:Major facilitator superfamily (MFS) profile domain-containing protein n=1 Tax=Entomortierella chlamydospora TaxID=101097 RepID=A0A9P6MZV6_9FUNG|nr:hypothetical protein BGZ80_004918 [Entomortierella chlamydospora]